MADDNKPDYTPDKPITGGVGTPVTNSTGPVNGPNDVPPNQSDLDDTHQVTDTGIQEEEVYEEGLAGAAEATEPDPRDTVVDYDPDKRKD